MERLAELEILFDSYRDRMNNEDEIFTLEQKSKEMKLVMAEKDEEISVLTERLTKYKEKMNEY